MTVVYLDSLIILNTIMDYLLLLASARLAGEPLRRGRMGLGAALGGAYAGAAVLPGLGFLRRPLWQLVCAAVMVLVGLGASRRLLRQIIIFFALAFAFGGGIFALSLLKGQGIASGALVGAGLELRVVLLSGAVCYAVLTAALSRVANHAGTRGALVRVGLTLLGRKVWLNALRDTGNTLTDPLTGRAVMVAQADRLHELFPPGACPEAKQLMDPARSMAQLEQGVLRGRLRLLPYRAVGVSCGMLLAVRVDSAVLEGEEKGSVLVALSPTPVSDGGPYCALVGSAF